MSVGGRAAGLSEGKAAVPGVRGKLPAKLRDGAAAAAANAAGLRAELKRLEYCVAARADSCMGPRPYELMELIEAAAAAAAAAATAIWL